MRPRISRWALTACLATALLLASASQAAGFAFITKWGREGAAPGRFISPYWVATDRAGHVYVFDQAGGGRVQTFTARGVFITAWGRGRVSGPGIAADRAGHVYLPYVDKVHRKHLVQKFTSRGRLIDQWALLPFRAHRIFGGIATDRAGNVYVGNDRWIQKYNSRGALLTRWTNSAPGASFTSPATGIATDAAGNVYVAGGPHINKFTGEGDFIATWMFSNYGLRPAGGLRVAIAVDPAGDVFVSGPNRVYEFTSDGAFLGQFGQTGSGNGEFRGQGPRGLATDASGDLYAADAGNDRIQKFGEPSSAFSLTRVTRDRRRGSARLLANVAGIGRLTAAGEGIKDIRRRAKGAGEVVLPITPNGTTWERLLEQGRATVEVEVTYTPTTPPGAPPASKSRRITLILERG